ncbi:PEP-utilizing enzyme [Nocardia sp. NPDC059246]|uniref:PEP-utilizing enzyme n=1 Tax=unclassified Nocardia TaxID=2637762 RepID=UPI0036B81F92
MTFDTQWMERAGGDPLHNPYENSGTVWTTVNAGEVFPGVPTPLTWSICGASFEWATRQGCAAIGGLRRSQVAIPDSIDERFFNIWYGRAALNVSLLGHVANCMPGSSSDSIEEAYFGGALPETSATSVLSRYPIVAGKMPVAAVRARRAIYRLEAEADAWWRQTVTHLPTSPDGLVALLAEAYARMAAVTTEHVINTMIGQGVFDMVRKVAEQSGQVELAATAVTGGESPEARTVAELWEVVHGQRRFADFVGAHGFHGPGESELSSRSWREDSAPLERLIATYRTLGDDASPAALQERKRAAAADAEHRLVAGSGRLVRGVLPVLLGQARTYMALREVGRGAMLRTVDVTRAAARALGTHLVAADALAEADDIFYLTTRELLAPPAEAKALAGVRRADRERYLSLEIPSRFVGDVAATEPEDQGDVSVLEAIGASAGTVEGRVRVMLEAGDDDLLPGEVLVCRTTDPGWASYFQVAAAVVVEIGGQMSHGAIVAREIGIPCVINAGQVTRRLRTGDLVRVDGDGGVVTVLERAQPVATARDQAEAVTEFADLTAHLAILRVIRLKGSVTADTLATVLGHGSIVVAAALDTLRTAAAIKVSPRGARITPAGRQALEELLYAERSGVDGAAMAVEYERFTEVNGDFKAIVTRWQQRDGEANDHCDATYDNAVRADLAETHQRVMPILDRVGTLAPRLQRYRHRLAEAMAKVEAGDDDWLLSPLIDSYHTVWFELHEELIQITGHTRISEAAAGRAQ